ncbi:MAG: hypothetical protein ACI970_001578 [Myxococcota bacterium]|jgi:hypothetical protein
MVNEDVPANPADIDWTPVFAHLAWLQSPKAKFGQVIPAAELPDGGFTMGFDSLSDRSQEVVDAMYAAGVVGPGVDWARWLDGAGAAIAKDTTGDVITDAPLDDVRRLLVAIVRGARFNEGLLLEAFLNGSVRRLIERAQVLMS